MKFGMLLSHFGRHATPERLLEGSRRLEELGFDSVWVRDHLLWKPYELDRGDHTFIEPFLTLAAVAAVTERIQLGTAVLIPVRWPLKVAQNFACLSWIAGRQIIAGFGLGSNPAELRGAGFSPEERELIYEETVQICKRVWTEDNVTWHGRKFHLEGASIEPKPVAPIEVWYGGKTRAAVRRAVKLCDGWLPGRVPIATLDDLLVLLKKLEAEHDKKLKVGVSSIVKIDRDRQRARQDIDVHAIATASSSSYTWIKPPSGEFRTIEDLEGLLIAGTPEDVVQQIQKFVDRGIEHFIFDVRFQFDRYTEVVQLIAEEVLPHLR